VPRYMGTPRLIQIYAHINGSPLSHFPDSLLFKNIKDIVPESSGSFPSHFPHKLLFKSNKEIAPESSGSSLSHFSYSLLFESIRKLHAAVGICSLQQIFAFRCKLFGLCFWVKKGPSIASKQLATDFRLKAKIRRMLFGLCF